LRGLGFQEVLIVTDHGFYLNTATEAGDVGGKPPGEWLTIHERFLLGDGAGDAANFVLPAERLGIRGDFSQAAGPRALVAYRAGQTYFHGGVSLQEAVVPVISIRLRGAEPQTAKKPSITLSYKRGKNITTRLPVFEIAAGTADLFSADAAIEILLEAHDRSGNVVGEAKPGGPVNPVTRTVALKPGTAEQVTLRMEMDFEGKFTVKALDPSTLTTYDKLDLETDYTV
ncbi:MAG: PglZ domain-containing protein, partial [Chloroflexota bacterium]|nr:PglZ domain-containing protein [Chloroflexota bacterium]